MPPRRHKSSSDKVVVPAVSALLAQPFRLHCQKRHPNLGFWNRGEHAADHRLHADALDHVHREERVDDEPPGANDPEIQ
jgi:hypothetical protein